MEITKFGLKNFRIFKEHFDFELAPIMVLTGQNNSGKSSLSKALLLLKENEDVVGNGEVLLKKFNYFTGEHNLGNHKNVINRKGENVGFYFTFYDDYKFLVELDEEGRFYDFFYKITTSNNELVLSQRLDTFTINIINVINYFKSRIQSKFLYNNSSKFDLSIDFKKIEKLIYFLEESYDNNDIINISFEDDFDIENINLEESCIECFIHIFYRITKVRLSENEIRFLVPVSEKSFFSFSDLVYVHTMQESVKRSYSNSDNLVLLSNIRRDIFKEVFDKYKDKYELTYIADSESIKKSDVFDRQKKIFIEKWLKKFEIGETLSYGYSENTDTYFIKIDDKSLLEYGLGFGLIVNILLAIENPIHSNRKRKRVNFPATYVIEEPETGLHPAFQSKIAEMLVDLQKTFNVNLIIETHSEYFIKKLQYLTAINEIKPDDAVIYYFNNPKKVPEGEEQIKKITIDKNGSLSDSFGPGFIDEGTNLKFEILRLNRERQN